MPALLHAAGNRGDLELVNALLDWPGVNWYDERNPKRFSDQVAQIHAVYYPTPMLPERDVQADPTAQLRADLLWAGRSSLRETLDRDADLPSRLYAPLSINKPLATT